MRQTENTYRVLREYDHLCLWCLRVVGRIRPAHGGHHILGRAKSDRPEDIIPLCAEHHRMAHEGKITKEELYEAIHNVQTQTP